ncbi:hypothetical protein ACOSQ3_003686 [Xanthoceras sorbifolium]
MRSEPTMTRRGIEKNYGYDWRGDNKEGTGGDEKWTDGYEKLSRDSRGRKAVAVVVVSAALQLHSSLPQLFNFSFPLTSSHASLPQLLASSSPSHVSSSSHASIVDSSSHASSSSPSHASTSHRAPPTSETESHA